jgi:hypothetical protein
LNTVIFFVAGFILLAAQSTLVLHEVSAARSRDAKGGQSLDAAWAALPALLVLALLAYSLLQILRG